MENTRTEYLSTANYERYNIWVMGIPKGEETEKGKEEIFEVIMTEKFDDRHQTANPGSSEYTM